MATRRHGARFRHYPVMGKLCEEIETVASMLPCNRILIILESSDRADPVVKRCFGRLTSLNASRAIPVEHWFMAKSANEPWLEVADFVVSAAGSEIRRRQRGEAGHAPDFKDVFGRLPAEYARYREITRVTIHADGRVRIDGGWPTGPALGTSPTSPARLRE